MMNGEITIGRSGNSDIVISEDCIYASQMHATMYMDGKQLMYRDNSRNGTMINGTSVHNRAIPVEFGDAIMIAGDYPLDWNQVERFFPKKRYPESNQQGYRPTPRTYVKDFNNEGTPDFTWNWGAFMLYPLWGFWNGCWWGIFISLFFGWTMIPSILFGAYGSRWAWSNKKWRDADEFNQMQAAWRPWGIAIFVINVFCWLITLFFCYGFLIGILSYIEENM